MKHKKGIQSATILRTYEQLSAYVTAFAAGHINLLIVLGTHGLSKSRTVREVLGEACWIEGHATPFGIYRQLYAHRDEFIVLDDVDSLYSDKNGVRLLKCLCQTEASKTVAWQSASRALERAGIPREFSTSSRVIIICNDWRTVNRNVAALQDRGHLLEFRPSATEVHRKAATWFEDAEILEWFGRHLDRLTTPSLRLYIRAAELKASGLDWKQVVPLPLQPERLRLVAKLKEDESFPTEEARVREFRRLGGGCRATYFNHARRLRESGH